jgi:hypothetical protein
MFPFGDFGDPANRAVVTQLRMEAALGRHVER